MRSTRGRRCQTKALLGSAYLGVVEGQQRAVEGDARGLEGQELVTQEEELQVGPVDFNIEQHLSPPLLVEKCKHQSSRN